MPPSHSSAFEESQPQVDSRKVVSGDVLVIDDDEQIRTFLLAALEAEGLSVQGAGTGREGIRRAMEHHPRVVVLDIMLPDMTAVQIAERLRGELGHTLPILAITAHAAPREQAESVGAFAYLAKPFNLNELVDIVLERLGSRDSEIS